MHADMLSLHWFMNIRFGKPNRLFVPVARFSQHMFSRCLIVVVCMHGHERLHAAAANTRRPAYLAKALMTGQQF